MALKVVDGRTIRREKSRQRIIEVMIQLLLEGNVEPTAEQVGQLAGLTRRTVFRHFDDMESLYREIILTVQAQIAALPIENGSTLGWREKLDQFIVRRASRFEKYMPLAIANQSLRHRSSVVEDDAQQYSRWLKQVLEKSLPDNLVADAISFAGIDAVLSWDMWIRLRRDQKLSVADATQVTRNTIHAIVLKAGI